MDILQTSFFYLISINFKWPCAYENEHLSLSCASLNFILAATSSVTLLPLPNLLPWLASLRAPMKWQSEAARSEVCGGWERAVCIL